MDLAVTLGVLSEVAGLLLIALSIPMKRSLKKRMIEAGTVPVRIVDRRIDPGGEGGPQRLWKVTGGSPQQSSRVFASKSAYEQYAVGDWVEVFEHPVSGRFVQPVHADWGKPDLRPSGPGGSYVWIRASGIVLLVGGIAVIGVTAG